MISAKGGEAFAPIERCSIEPQAQLAWQHNDFDDVLLGGARVQQATRELRRRCDSFHRAGRIDRLRERGSCGAIEVAAGATLALTPAASLYGEIGTLWRIVAAGVSLPCRDHCGRAGNLGAQQSREEAIELALGN